MPSRFPVLLAAGASAATLTSALVAQAATFADDGTLVFAPGAAATADFEDAVEAEAAGLTTADDPGALSGKRILTLGAFAGADVPVSLPPSARTYRASLWVRDSEAACSLDLYYSDRVDDLAVLYPTGRVTSDGWVELANDHIRVDGARLLKASVGLFSAAGASIDAVEIVADGDLSSQGRLNAPCEGAADPNACGAGQLCYWSECRDVNAWVPPIPADRAEVAAYLRGRLDLLFGPYLERTTDLPASRVALDQMAFAEDPWTYWNGFMLAVRRLHDGHTTTSGIADFVYENPRPLSLCFIEGDADLSHEKAPKDPLYLDVLVSHTGKDHTLDLRAGDRLVSVDGRHPIAWARSLVGTYWAQPAISNHRTFAEIATTLRSTISRFAHEIEVVRCDPETGSCGDVETIVIGALPPDPPGTPASRVTCDNRPLRHLEGSPESHTPSSSDAVYSGIVRESDPDEKIYGIEWESLYTTTGSDGVGPALKAAVATWKADAARGVILDHRTGFGGTTLGPKPLWDFAVQRHASDLYVDRQLAEDEQPTLESGLATFGAGLSSGDVEYIGSASPHTEVPVALLITEDVSASDWLPFGMKGAPHVRIFGPFETNGAFSTRYSFGYWLGLGYVIAVGDTYASDGRTLNGNGVSPDEIVLPKQSDLLAGKDTVFEAALAWVREEITP